VGHEIPRLQEHHKEEEEAKEEIGIYVNTNEKCNQNFSANKQSLLSVSPRTCWSTAESIVAGPSPLDTAKDSTKRYMQDIQ